MPGTALKTIATALGIAGLAFAQHEGWTENQVNASICVWSQPRAAVIRDTIYLDGGFMDWLQGLSNGDYGPIDQARNPLGLMFMLNFSQPFNLTQNLTALLDFRSKAPGGIDHSANNEAPNFLDGGMLANDGQFALYGGLVKNTDAFDPPREDDVMTYQRYQYGPEKESWRVGFRGTRLPEDMTRYIAFGGAASAPSENKAWYFGGLRGESWGEIFQRSGNLSQTPQNASHTLITLDLEDQLNLEWSNDTLPSNIRGRANPEVVWVPVGEEGILVVLGGVTYPDWVTATRISENSAQSKEESDKFMQTIDIYDVANKTWYKQETQDGPTALTRGCAVVAPAQDRSSFNIYYYGGYPGVDPKVPFNDAVWVLSIPSFTWTQVKEGRPNHGRAGHKCFMPYPDQMMVVAGYTSQSGQNVACLEGGIIQMFNLTSAEWMDEYHPEKYYDYGVPSAVRSAIGGDATGGATETTPIPSGWTDDDLADIFDTSYETSKIQTWYPYAVATEPGRPVLDDEDEDDDEDGGGGGGGGGVPSWVAPTLGVVLGLVFLTAVLVGICLWRRRKFLRKRGSSEASTDENGHRILSWIRGQPSEAKAPTVTTEETPSHPDMAEVSSPPPPAPIATRTQATTAPRFEMMDTAIAELPDTSRRPELQDTGLTPVDIIQKHTHFATAPHASANASYYGSVSGNEASSISRSSGALGYPSRTQSPSLHQSEPPSPIPASAKKSRMASGVSGLSDREASHLRQISEATVSSATSDGDDSGPGPSSTQHKPEPRRFVPTALGTPPLDSGGNPSPLSPGAISPPTAGVTDESDDYISAKGMLVSPGTVSPTGAAQLRRSAFKESEDDMDGKL